MQALGADDADGTPPLHYGNALLALAAALMSLLSVRTLLVRRKQAARRGGRGSSGGSEVGGSGATGGGQVSGGPPQPLEPADAVPLVLLVNPKSGGGKGSAVLEAARGLPNMDAYALTRDGLAACVARLAALRRGAQPRVVVAGGDGTVTAVAQSLFTRGLACPIAVLPLGTGNDGARSLGSRGVSSISEASLQAWFGAVRRARIVASDIYSVEFSAAPHGGIVCVRGGKQVQLAETTVKGVFCMYLSVGADARLPFAVELFRQRHPLLNKVVYALAGTWVTLAGVAPVASLIDALEVEEGAGSGVQTWRLGGEATPLPPIQSLVAMTIPSYAGGTNLASFARPLAPAAAAWLAGRGGVGSGRRVRCWTSPLQLLGGVLAFLLQVLLCRRCRRSGGASARAPPLPGAPASAGGEDGGGGSGSNADGWAPPSRCDGRLELLGVSSLAHEGFAIATQTGLGGGLHQLAQPSRFRVTFKPPPGLSTSSLAVGGAGEGVTTLLSGASSVSSGSGGSANGGGGAGSWLSSSSSASAGGAPGAPSPLAAAPGAASRKAPSRLRSLGNALKSATARTVGAVLATAAGRGSRPRLRLRRTPAPALAAPEELETDVDSVVTGEEDDEEEDEERGGRRGGGDDDDGAGSYDETSSVASGKGGRRGGRHHRHGRRRGGGDHRRSRRKRGFALAPHGNIPRDDGDATGRSGGGGGGAGGGDSASAGGASSGTTATARRGSLPGAETRVAVAYPAAGGRVTQAVDEDEAAAVAADRRGAGGEGGALEPPPSPSRPAPPPPPGLPPAASEAVPQGRALATTDPIYLQIDGESYKVFGLSSIEVSFAGRVNFVTFN